MPRFAPFAAVRRTLTRGKREAALANDELAAVPDEDADSSADVSTSEIDVAGDAHPTSAEKPSIAAEEESVPSAVDDEPTGPGNRTAVAALSDIAPKAKAMIPPRHRWRPLLIGGLRLMLLSPKAPGVPMVVASLAAAGWAVLIGLLCGWTLAGLGAVPDSANVAPWIWLVGNHVGFSTADSLHPVTVLPLGLLVISVLPLRRVGRFLAAEFSEDGTNSALLAGITYPLVAVVVAVTWGDDHFAILPTVVAASLCAVVGITWGWRRHVRVARSQSPLLIGVRWTVAAPLLMAVLLVGSAFLANGAQVLEVQNRLATTPGEHIGLILLQVAYLPNVLIWAGSYALGAGITIGSETVSPFADGVPLLPDLPILYLLPEQSPRWTAALPIVIALGAAWGAMRMNRRQPSYPLTARLVRAAALAGSAAGVWFLLVRLSSGSLATERLDYIGPAAGTTFVAFLVFGAGALGWALLPTIAADARPMAVDLRDRVTRGAKRSEDVVATEADAGAGTAPHPAGRPPVDS